MIQAMLSGVSALNAQQTEMNVIGNNLANVNTTAFKSSDVTFQDLIGQTLEGAQAPTSTSGGTNPVQYGLGVQIAGTNVNESQGSLSATNNNTDLAIQGNGFFMVSNGSSISYTRDGGLNLDSNGNLVQASSGQELLGWTADNAGKIDSTAPIGPASTIQIPIGQLNAVQQTTTVTLAGNLDAQASQTGTTASQTWSLQETIYDSLGGAHQIQVTFNNPVAPPATTPTPPANAVSSWDWTATDITGGGSTPIGSSATTGNTPIYFDSAGNEINTTATGANQITLAANGTEQAFSSKLDFSAVTELSTQSSVAASNQNGYAPGSLESFSIGTDGTITGLFTNGLTRPLAQIAMSVFPNPEGMQQTGANLWQTTNNSGIPVIGTPNTGGRGQISAGYLEQSNVDISTEFTNLIITQRGFEANTKVVTTVDEMLQDLINMKH